VNQYHASRVPSLTVGTINYVKTLQVNGSFHTPTGVPMVKNNTFPSLAAMNAYARKHGLGSGWYGALPSPAANVYARKHGLTQRSFFDRDSHSKGCTSLPLLFGGSQHACDPTTRLVDFFFSDMCFPSIMARAQWHASRKVHVSYQLTL
jgi:hypothetical protein